MASDEAEAPEEVLFEIDGLWLNFRHAETERRFTSDHTKKHSNATTKAMTLIWAIATTFASISFLYRRRFKVHQGFQGGCGFGIYDEWAMTTSFVANWVIAIFVQVASRTSTRPLVWQVVGTLYWLTLCTTFNASKNMCLAEQMQYLFVGISSVDARVVAGTYLWQGQLVTIGLLSFLAVYGLRFGPCFLITLLLTVWDVIRLCNTHVRSPWHAPSWAIIATRLLLIW